MDMTPVESSNLHSVGYDPALNELHVRFIKWERDPNPDNDGKRVATEGSLYRYLGVPPEKHVDMLKINADVLEAKAANTPPTQSVAQYFNAEIKNGGFKYEKIA